MCIKRLSVMVTLCMSVSIAFCLPFHLQGAKVIAVVGQTTPVAQFYEGTGLDTQEHMAKPKTPKTLLIDYKSHSADLSEGTVQTRAVNFPKVIHPIFIVGTDKKSIHWLNRYQTKLKALGAIGFLVNVQNNAAYEHFVKATGLSLMSVNGDELAKEFHVKHYPVLISQHWIEQ